MSGPNPETIKREAIMGIDAKKLSTLRRSITENLRVQKDGPESIPYIDVSNALDDICARQNHVVFARRGCGKSLLLHSSGQTLSKTSIRAVYLNCEDFKRHSFPNVLIEILDALFAELETNLKGWFGKKRRSKEVISSIRAELNNLRSVADQHEENVKDSRGIENANAVKTSGKLDTRNISFDSEVQSSQKNKNETEREYRVTYNKLQELDKKLPSLKNNIREFFMSSDSVKAVFLQIDDFYHLKRSDQPFVMDYIHRLCKDVPLFFKIATLRHASKLYADRDGQPIGAQERHDYQPIDIDYTFADFNRTKESNRKIFHEFGKIAKMNSTEIDDLFKGQGFDRLVMAGGGVPRDCLSVFLNILSDIQSRIGDNRIGKDDVRIRSKENFEHRIEELKQDSEGNEQDVLIKGIYVIRKFCLDKKTNVFLVSEQLMQQKDKIRDLIYRLLDYRIVHGSGTALTHKSQLGAYQAFAIDIGCYGHLRKHDGKFTEIDLSSTVAKEKMRSAPILDEKSFEDIWAKLPSDPMNKLLTENEDEAA
jgi:hypothetical protein